MGVRHTWNSDEEMATRRWQRRDGSAKKTRDGEGEKTRDGEDERQLRILQGSSVVEMLIKPIMRLRPGFAA